MHPYPSDVSDEEWHFIAPYLTLMDEAAPQREHSLREVFNGLHWFVRAGASWRMMLHDLPPWHTIYQQTLKYSQNLGPDVKLLSCKTTKQKGS